MIEVTEVCKAFGSVQALQSFNMKVLPGSVYGLVGPNGAGKTTALKHIAGAIRPDSGTVQVCGGEVFENIAVKARIATIPSDLYVPDTATVDEMRHLYDIMFPDFDNDRFRSFSRYFEIDPKRPMRTLSKGMQKQAVFWLVLSRRPEVMLLDEPVDGLDPAARRMVWGLMMDEVANRNMTVVSSSHNLRELTDVCDYVGIMEKGSMRLERSLTDLQENFVKVQVAFENDQVEIPDELDYISRTQEGRLTTLVVRSGAARTEEILETVHPVFVNVLPLSLEEIFIYELGGDHGDASVD